MQKKIVFLFPGQGAQYVGMGKDLYSAFAVAKETFQEAEEILSFPLSRVMFEGPFEKLTETEQSQPAIFVHSVAMLRVLQRELPMIVPGAVSGLSLGEYTALFASGRLGFQETLRLIHVRATAMHRACQQRVGTMAAVLGVSEDLVRSVVDPLSKKGQVWIANYNAPGQIVISGTQEGIQEAAMALKELSSGRLLPLQVQGAFHSGLMQAAQEHLAPWMAQLSFRSSQVGFVMNVPGDFVEEEASMRSHLLLQVTHSVRWEQGIRALMRRGADLYLEIGPGKILSGLNRKMGAGPTESLDKIVDLEKVAKYVLCPA